jgi:uncharacterized OB-fold protein
MSNEVKNNTLPFSELIKMIKRKCRNCGTVNEFEDRWCRKCGAKIATFSELLYLKKEYFIKDELPMYW